MEVRAILRDMGVPPRKARLVAEAIKGRKVTEALAYLQFLPNASAKPMWRLLKSAVANAENNYALDEEDLYVVSIVADQAPTIKRGRVRSRGRYSRVLKRRSHITVIVSDEYDLIPKEYRKKRYAR
jgi:large subunit ribosomal protein L22